MDLQGPTRQPDQVIQPTPGTIVAPSTTFQSVIDSGDEPMQLRHVWVILRRRAWLVILTVLIITLPVLFLTATISDFYDAKARIEVNPERADAGITEHNIDQSPEDPTYMSTQLQLMKSPAVLRRVVLALDLEHDPVYRRSMITGGRLMRRLMRLFYIGKEYDVTPSGRPPLTPSLRPAVSAAGYEESQRTDRFVKDLSGRINIELVREARNLVRETRLVDITARHANPEMAARLANAVADAYVLATREQNTNGARSDNENLTRRVVELQGEIRDIERRLATYGQGHDIVSLDPGQNIAIERLVSFNTNLVEAENNRKLAEARYHSALDGDSAAVLIDDTDRRQIADIEASLASLRQKRGQLLLEATEKWPAVKEATEAIESTEAHLKQVKNQAAAAAVLALKTKYTEALDRETAMRGSFDRERRANLVQNQAAVDYRLMQQEIDTRKQILGALLARVGKTAVSEATASGNARVIDYSFVPDRSEPAGPPRLLFVLIAGLISLVIGAVAALAREHLDDRLRSPDEVRAALRLPSLAVVYSSGLRSISSLLHRKRKTLGNEFILSSSAPPWLADDYRRLRTSVLLTGRAAAPKRILVTSSIPGEGKTTTAVNIASSLAQTGKKVILVDADMRRPRIHTLFNLNNDRGLSTILGDKEGVQDITQFVLTAGESGIGVLTSGPRPTDPTELLGSPRCEELFRVLSEGYEHVVVDAPSIGTAVDALMLSRSVDGTLLIVKAGAVSRAAARDALEQLRGAGGKLLGVVLNSGAKSPSASYYG